MSESQVLFLVLCLIYLSDCVAWFHAHSGAFVTWGNTVWKAVRPAASLFHYKDYNLFFLNPFPPLGTVYQGHTFPVSLSPRGACAYVSQLIRSGERPAQTKIFVRYGNIRAVRTSGAEVLVNDKLFVKCRSGAQALLVKRSLDALVPLDETGRELEIRRLLREHLDAAAATGTISGNASELSFLSFLCNLTFAAVYVAAPLLAWKFGFLVVVLPAAAATILSAVVVTVAFHGKHRKIFPGDREARVVADIKMLVCPPTCIRAVDMITAGFFHDRHPLALAAAVLSPAAFADYARDVLNDLRHPMAEEVSEEDALETVKWYSARLLEAAEELVRGTGKVAGVGRSGPVAPEAGDGHYCPRCGCEYTAPPGPCCPDCEGVNLEKRGTERETGS